MTLKRTSRKQPVSGRRTPGKHPMPDRSFWDGIAELGRSLPGEEWAKIPRDAARNLDHYLDGTPRQD
ncbi:MAG: hypothetical protein M3P30_16705 [Chloroflexota bacterium]|nr:hypothetical protein [Chloroflexota bacterium]